MCVMAESARPRGNLYGILPYYRNRRERFAMSTSTPRTERVEARIAPAVLEIDRLPGAGQAFSVSSANIP